MHGEEKDEVARRRTAATWTATKEGVYVCAFLRRLERAEEMSASSRHRATKT
jgi:hypothetical protein